MKANIKGFIRNVVNDILQELLDEEMLYDSYELLIDEDDEHFVAIKQVAEIVTEKHLDCIIEEETK